MIGKKEHQSCEEVKNDHRKQTSLLIINKPVIAKKTNISSYKTCQ